MGQTSQKGLEQMYVEFVTEGREESERRRQ